MYRFILIPLLALSACQKDETVSGQTLDSDTWVLQSLNTEAISTEITLTFPEEGKISGRAPCNRYFGAQTAPLPWFSVKNIGATKMACPNLALEAQYFEALAQMTLAEISGNTLVLKNDAGNALVYQKR